MHALAFDEADLVDGSGHLGVHVYDIVRHHGADTRHHNREVRDLHLRGHHRHGRYNRRGRRRWLLTIDPPCDQASDADHTDHRTDDAALLHARFLLKLCRLAVDPWIGAALGDGILQTAGSPQRILVT